MMVKNIPCRPSPISANALSKLDAGCLILIVRFKELVMSQTLRLNSGLKTAYVAMPNKLRFGPRPR